MLRAKLIEENLSFSGWSIRAYDQIESTNLIIKDALRKGCAEGIVATALIQGGGYGRQGRLWASPLGGLYFSFALCPFGRKTPDQKINTSTISLVVALSLRHAFQELGVYETQIKWPNDVLINGAKACGISLEGVTGGICVGVGVNVFPVHDQWCLSSAYRTAYVGPLLTRLAQQPEQEGMIESSTNVLSVFQEETLERIIVAFLNIFKPLYDRWLEEGFSLFCDEYNACLFNVGDAITLETIDSHTLLEGVVVGVDKEGRLLLEQSDGRIIPASSGEVHTLHKEKQE